MFQHGINRERERVRERDRVRERERDLACRPCCGTLLMAFLNMSAVLALAVDAVSNLLLH